jgi:hypothetical protein
MRFDRLVLWPIFAGAFGPLGVLGRVAVLGRLKVSFGPLADFRWGGWPFGGFGPVEGFV